VFDVYGTIAHINDKRSPFAGLLALGQQRGRPKTDEDARTLMGHSLGLRDAAALLQIDLETGELEKLERDLGREVESVTLYPDAVPVIRALQARGIKIALCSNLAAPYASPIKALLPMPLDYYGWSFELGLIKPDRRIYEHVCDALACAPHKVLMVGDTRTADVDGPSAIGMQSMLLDRRTTRSTPHVLHSLEPLIDLVQ
jgi:HAD superfamily hydrolase (TIGR01549 family)